MMVAIVLIVLLLIYILWPIDLIPDIIPVIGWIDDIIALMLMLGIAYGTFK